VPVPPGWLMRAAQDLDVVPAGRPNLRAHPAQEVLWGAGEDSEW